MTPMPLDFILSPINLITPVLLFPLLLPPHLTLTRPRWPNKYINKYYIREVMNAWLPTKRLCAAAHLSYHNTSEENCLHCLHALATTINSHRLKINPKTHEIMHPCLRYILYRLNHINTAAPPGGVMQPCIIGLYERVRQIWTLLTAHQ